MAIQQLNAAASGARDVVRAVGRRSRVLVVHEHDENSAGTGNFADYLYREFAAVTSRMAGAFVGGRLGLTSTQPIAAAAGTLTNAALGSPFWIYDRPAGLNPAKNTGSAYGLVYDTSAAAGDGTAGIASDSVPAGSQEIIYNAGGGPSAGQLLATFTAQARSSAGPNSPVSCDAWQVDALRGVFFWHQPAADASGAKPITGGPSLSLGIARGSSTPAADVTAASGTTATIRSLQATIAAGAGAPKAGVLAAGTGSGGRRFTPVGMLLESTTATQGLTLICFGNPYTCANDYSVSNEPIAVNSCWDAIAAGVGTIDAVVMCIGSYITHQTDPPGTNGEYFDGLDDINDLLAGRYLGQITGSGIQGGNIAEQYNDFVHHIRLGVGSPAHDGGIPVVIVRGCFAGAGANLQEAEKILDYWERAILWGIGLKQLVPGVNDTRYTQFALPNCVYINPWAGISCLEILTGQGPRNFIERGGTSFEGDWAVGQVNTVGMVRVKANAGTYARNNYGYFVCVRAHTSAASGVNGPPGDVDQTGWAACDFRLNDNGKQRVARAIAQRTAYPTSGRDRAGLRMRLAGAD